MKLAQIQLEAEPLKPWFLISEDTYAETTEDEERIELPDNFLAETDEAVLRYVPDDPSEDDPERDLVKEDYDQLRKKYRDEDTGGILTGEPEAYALMGNYFRIFPTPDDTYTLHMLYYWKDDELDTNIENQWLKYVPLLVMGKAGKIISMGPLRDSGAWQVFDSWEKEGRAALANFIVSRDMMNKDLQVGGSH